MPVERKDRDVAIVPAGPVVGEVTPPGSKSLTNRYLACAAMADGSCVLQGVSVSDDAVAMIDGLEQLGVPVQLSWPRREIRVTGTRGQLLADEAEIDVGHAGTAMRFLAALACLGQGRFRLDGSARMRERPIGALVGALQALGARIGYGGVPGYPPVQIDARGLVGGEVVFHEPPSSQFVSAVLMVSPAARQDVLIRIDGPLVSQPYVQMTLRVMRSMGVEALEHAGRRFVVPALQRYQPGTYRVEPDASAATYFWAAAAVTGGAVRVLGLTRDSCQGDSAFVDVLAAMGCDIHEAAGGIEVRAPATGRLKGIDVDLNAMPDTVQTLAMIALFADGPTVIRNVANLRIKETDRISALAAELTRLGAHVETRADGLTVHPPERVRPAVVETYDDHRMAMSAAVVGLAVEGLVVRAADCVSKSFPDFFEMWHDLSAGGGNAARR
jgi:3-phosphoshikimate 1-carboxyvinyltransferase